MIERKNTLRPGDQWSPVDIADYVAGRLAQTSNNGSIENICERLGRTEEYLGWLTQQLAGGGHLDLQALLYHLGESFRETYRVKPCPNSTHASPSKA